MMKIGKQSPFPLCAFESAWHLSLLDQETFAQFNSPCRCQIQTGQGKLSNSGFFLTR